MNDPEIYDMPKALQAFGSEMVVREALRTYLAEVNSMLTRVDTALEANDRVALGKAAHWLRGGLSFLHAPRVRVSCLAFDKAVQDEASVDEVRARFEDLRQEADRLSAHLRDFLG